MAVEARALAAPPLCVDLDGTLIRSDVLLESLLLLLKRNPFYLFLAVFWLFSRGKAGLKAQIAARVTLNPAALPYNKDLLAWLKTERVRGRELWLCTAADEKLAMAVAEHVGLFDGVFGSDGIRNLAGQNKADQLVERFGRGGFDYCGNERRDLAIWRCARGAIVVNAAPALERQLSSAPNPSPCFKPSREPAKNFGQWCGPSAPTSGRRTFSCWFHCSQRIVPAICPHSPMHCWA